MLSSVLPLPGAIHLETEGLLSHPEGWRLRSRPSAHGMVFCSFLFRDKTLGPVLREGKEGNSYGPFRVASLFRRTLSRDLIMSLESHLSAASTKHTSAPHCGREDTFSSCTRGSSHHPRLPAPSAVRRVGMVGEVSSRGMESLAEGFSQGLYYKPGLSFGADSALSGELCSLCIKCMRERAVKIRKCILPFRIRMHV